MMMPVDVGQQLGALADPTRRAIFDLVRRRPASVRELTDELPVSQPAVSQHLRVLAEARLVRATPVGTRRIYAADPRGVEAMRAWIAELWDDVLDAYTDAAIERSEQEAAP
jgi:DNA-binding transcriptional ArsR family regulator